MSDSLKAFVNAHQSAGHTVSVHDHDGVLQAICLTCRAGIIPTTVIWWRNLPKDDES